MAHIKLNDNLAYWRAERPDERKMDEFIRQSKVLQSLLVRAASAIGEAGYEDFDIGLMEAISKETE